MTYLLLFLLLAVCCLTCWLCRKKPSLLRSALAGAAAIFIFRWFSWYAAAIYGAQCGILICLSRRPAPEDRKQHPVARKVLALLRALIVAAMCPLSVRAAIETASLRGLHAILYFGIAGAFALLAVAMLFSDAIKSRISGRLSPKLLTALTVCTPLVCFFLMEYTWNLFIPNMEIRYLAGNLLLICAVYILMLALSPSRKLAIGLAWLVSVCFGTANYYLSLFRGNPLMPGDFYSLGTAANVIGGYDFLLSGRIMLCWLLFGLCWFFLPMLPEPAAEGRSRGHTAVRTAVAVLAVCVSSLFLVNTDFAAKYEIKVSKWKVSYNYNVYGSAMYFASLVRETRHIMPENYSLETVNQTLDTYAGKNAEENTEGEVLPTVIAVMNESFSDLHVLGDFDTTLPYMEHYYDRTDYIRSGKLYVSIFGAGTSDSEFEFLTGNSMAFLPTGAVPYQDYDLENVGNLAAMFKDKGYITTAIHPENKSNWNRQRNYEKFGFDAFLSEENFAVDSQRFRGHISDRASYDKIIEVFEASRDKPQFIFNVTMQNHGGYKADSANITASIYDEELEQVEMTGKYSLYEAVNTYLSLMRESDKALYELLNYFEAVEEPVIICFFGDHLPSVTQEWREAVLGGSEEMLPLEELQKEYAVPYFIWANYDTGAESRELDLSANYLGAELLEIAGIPGSAYTAYLQDVQRSVPIINALGYMDTQGLWHDLESEDTGVPAVLETYKMVQYNALFDEERNQAYYQ